MVVRTVATILAFFLFGIGAFGYAGAMSTVHHAEHIPCPLGFQAETCISPLAHLGHWQSSFVSAFLPTLLFALFLALPALYADAVRILRAPPAVAERFRRLLVPRHRLALAFSDGLVHPKHPH